MINFEHQCNEYVFEALIVAGILPPDTPGNFTPTVSISDIVEVMKHADTMDDAQRTSVEFLFRTPLLKLSY